MNLSAMTLDSGYSPDISLELLLNGAEYRVAALSESYFVMRQPPQLPAGSATLRLTVDKKVSLLEIELPTGIDPTRRRQSYRLLRTVEVSAA